MVQLERRIRTTVRMNNENDVNRAYAIPAEVEYFHESNVVNIHSGVVTLNKSALSTFVNYGTELNIQYINLAEEQQMAVLAAINDFINEVKETITINL